jgi:hypothetical protein
MGEENERYRHALRESARCKLRAAALRAEGNEEAARAHFLRAAEGEARAIEMLPDPSPETRLRSLVERCGCLLDGGDDAATKALWTEILRWSTEVSEETAHALLGRLRARMDPGERR